MLARFDLLYDCCRALQFVDSDGEVLDGAAEYDISFPAAPPIAANSFWSLTTGAVGATTGTLAGLPPPGVVNPSAGALPVSVCMRAEPDDACC